MWDFGPSSGGTCYFAIKVTTVRLNFAYQQQRLSHRSTAMTVPPIPLDPATSWQARPTRKTSAKHMRRDALLLGHVRYF